MSKIQPVVTRWKNTSRKEITYEGLSIRQRESGNGTKNTREKRHLQLNTRKKKRNTCGYRGACISKDDWTRGRGFNESITTKIEAKQSKTNVTPEKDAMTSANQTPGGCWVSVTLTQTFLAWTLSRLPRCNVWIPVELKNASPHDAAIHSYSVHYPPDRALTGSPRQCLSRAVTPPKGHQIEARKRRAPGGIEGEPGRTPPESPPILIPRNYQWFRRERARGFCTVANTTRDLLNSEKRQL